VLAEDQALPAQPIAPVFETSRLKALVRREWVVLLLLTVWTSFILFWRLTDPPKYIYDEVYHAFTGYLMQQNDPAVYEWWQSAQSLPNAIEGTQYEWTHPPLGKLIIGGSIKIFGNNSLGWRFSNALFGVICVLLMYAFVRALFRDRWLATLAASILTVEGLMFAESRIGTNDIFQLAFLLTAYLCFAFVLRRPARQTIGLLFLTGLFLGLALGTKWPAIYSIVLLGGIALIRGVWPARRVHLAVTAHGQPLTVDDPLAVQAASLERAGGPEAATRLYSAGQEAEAGAVSVTPAGAQTTAQAQPAERWGFLSRLGYLASAAVSMILVPAALYMASYIQMFLQPHEIPAEYAQIGPISLGPLKLGPSTLPNSSWWSMFVGEQWQMWHYHTTLTAGHPYYSKWWEWLLDIRPVFYYVDRSTEGYVANTYNLGNPLLYWGFPIAIVLSAWLLWRKRDWRIGFVLGALAINWLPWALSPRGMFFYHFLPTVPFAVLLVAYCVMWLRRQPDPKCPRVAGIYVALIFVSFAFFYTQLAAWTVPDWYADIHYWLPTWQ